jgi:FMN phosphatase YigB (HAD superfamily)
MADILILDAMGVLYEAGDDVAELLVPFVGKHGRTDLSAEAIDRDYVEASLGRMDTDAFWQRMGVDPSLEDAYLAGHRLIEGTLDWLPQLKQRYGRVACLSNDVASWSLKLRQRFGLGGLDRPLVHQRQSRAAQAVGRNLSAGGRSARRSAAGRCICR